VECPVHGSGARPAPAMRLALPELLAFATREDAVVQAGFEANAVPGPTAEGEVKKRGRPQQSPPVNLLRRLRDFKGAVAFVGIFPPPVSMSKMSLRPSGMPVRGTLLSLPRTCSKGRRHRGPQPTWVVTSQTSIFNHYNEFGSPYSSFSVCNRYATDPPVMVDGSGRFYGRLTLNHEHP